MPSRNSLQLMSPTKNKTFTGLFLNKKNELQPDLWLNKIDKLFSDKIEIYSNTGFTVDDIMIQLAKITLKATSEAIRLSAFNQNAFYQLQLDLEYFQRKLPVFVKLDK
ncbi:hypothetical protein K502DRAFT_323181 [Neoconidiobolus thromboides FSU 785]|nr:hypothetical protein K502DRAFT_323181 [Neoconidiobolus thromboides FSU 785]